MTQDVKPGFLVTQAKIAIFLSCLTALGAGYNGVSYLNRLEYRIAAVEEGQSRLGDEQKSLAVELRALNSSINQLNLTLREVQVRQSGGLDAQ